MFSLCIPPVAFEKRNADLAQLEVIVCDFAGFAKYIEERHAKYGKQDINAKHIQGIECVTAPGYAETIGKAQEGEYLQNGVVEQIEVVNFVKENVSFFVKEAVCDYAGRGTEKIVNGKADKIMHDGCYCGTLENAQRHNQKRKDKHPCVFNVEVDIPEGEHTLACVRCKQGDKRTGNICKKHKVEEAFAFWHQKRQNNEVGTQVTKLERQTAHF